MDRLRPPPMRNHSRPRLLAPVHGLWPDRRLLRSPLWLIPLTALLWGLMATYWTTLLRGLMATYWTVFTGLAQLPLLATLLVCSLTWHRVLSSGLARDWTVSGQGHASLAAAIFTPPWIIWWVSATALQIAHIWRVYGLGSSPDGLFVLIPGGPVFIHSYTPDHIEWGLISVTICTALMPFHLALWALVHQRVTELTVTSQRSPVVGFAVNLICCVGLWLGVRRVVHLAAHDWAFGLQGHWPLDWPLGLRLQMGMWLAWLLYLPLLLSAWWLLLILIRRQRRRWEGGSRSLDPG